MLHSIKFTLATVAATLLLASPAYAGAGLSDFFVSHGIGNRGEYVSANLTGHAGDTTLKLASTTGG
jgi:hypothetical protein